MHIAIFTSSYPRFYGDGTAPFVQSIAEHLFKAGHDVEVVAPYDTEVNAIKSANVKVHRFRYIWPERWHIMGHAKSLQADVRLRPSAYLLLPLFLLGSFIKLMRVTRAQKSQIIYVNWVLPNGPVAGLVSAIRGIPFVVSLHGSDIYIAQSNPVFRAVTGLIFRQAAAVTACSMELLQNAQKLGAPPDTHFLTWGADPNKFHPEAKNLALARSIGLDGHEFNIITLGRMVYKKGFDVLIHAYKKLAQDYPNTRLIIGGDGSTRTSLEELSKELNIQNQVIFTGRISWNKVPDFLSLGDIFALSSIQDDHGNLDGLPTVLLEAMACGLPIVASDIGGVNRVMTDGENGLLIPPGDSCSLAKTLDKMLNHPELRKKLSQAAYQAIVSEHNWDSVSSRLTKIFNEAIQ